MTAVVIIVLVIAIAVPAAVLYISRKRRQTYSSIYYVNNYGRESVKAQYHPVNNLTDEELEWLLRFYDNEIKTRYHKVAGGMLVENVSDFQVQIERDLKHRQLSDEQIDELTLKLFKSMERIERYDRDRYRKMDSCAVLSVGSVLMRAGHRRSLRRLRKSRRAIGHSPMI